VLDWLAGRRQYKYLGIVLNAIVVVGIRVCGAYTWLEYGTFSGITDRSPDAAGKLRFIVRTYYRLRRCERIKDETMSEILFCIACRPKKKHSFPRLKSVSRIADRLSGWGRGSGHLEIVEMDVAI